jgi:hypothetical protein
MAARARVSPSLGLQARLDCSASRRNPLLASARRRAATLWLCRKLSSSAGSVPGLSRRAIRSASCAGIAAGDSPIQAQARMVALGGLGVEPGMDQFEQAHRAPALARGFQRAHQAIVRAPLQVDREARRRRILSRHGVGPFARERYAASRTACAMRQ